MVNNVLDFNRIEKGKKRFRKVPGDPAPTVREAAEMFRPSIEERGYQLHVDVPAELSPFIARKGSIAVDGISLTVNSVENRCFTVNIIPYTWQHTALAHMGAGDRVNIEIDMMARYAARLMECTGT